MDDMTSAEHTRNAQNCEYGWEECDQSTLTPLQARATASAEHQRNISACKSGLETCDYSELTLWETSGPWPTSSAGATTLHVLMATATVTALG